MASLLTGGVGSYAGADGPVPTELVVRNANVHTEDPDRPGGSAVAIRQGVFVAVGDDDITPFVGARTRVIDALGRRAISGLNDSNLHVTRGGLNYFLELRWVGGRSLHRALVMLRIRAAATPRGQWVRVVGGWTSGQLVACRLPSIVELKPAAPDAPVFVLISTSLPNSIERRSRPSATPAIPRTLRAASSGAILPATPPAYCSAPRRPLCLTRHWRRDPSSTKRTTALPLGASLAN